MAVLAPIGRAGTAGVIAPATLTQFQEWERHIHAFVATDSTLLQAWENTGRLPDTSGELAGLTLGVKDIIDVAEFPTRNGSRACRDAKPAVHDASVVAALRAAGAHIVGKTTTTEYAYTDPTPCRNPHDIRRSPGGSSSGSGAAVAAGQVDVALGTQTAGSLIRPAAYCGVVGFKPSYGVLSTAGVTPLAPSFDTLGIIARSVALARRCHAVLNPAADPANAQAVGGCTASTLLLDRTTEPDAAMQTALTNAARALATLTDACVDRHPDLAVGALVADHRCVMNHEAATVHAALLDTAVIDSLQPNFRAGLEAGAAIDATSAARASGRLRRAAQGFWAHLHGIDLILTLPVPEGAPWIDGTTGFQDWLTPWTVFGGPLVCLPWGRDGQGRPLSVMLAAHPGQDATLLAAAAALEALAPELPPPSLPAVSGVA